MIVAAAAVNGLTDAVEALLPSGEALPQLLLTAAVAAVLANLVNNLPATLVLVPVAAAAGGEGAVLAVLVGVNVGPNLTYTGSLATLLWRRVLRGEDEGTSLPEFVRLGAMTVPAGVDRRRRAALGRAPGGRMTGGVRALVWIGEGTWEATVDAAAALLPSDAEIELLHVAFDAETFVRAGRRGLLGRHPHRVGGSGSADPVSTATEEEAAALLADAAARLGRDAARTARRGRAQDEVLDAARDADVLVLARGGEPDHLGPKSIGHAERFVLDHASCAVLLVH